MQKDAIYTVKNYIYLLLIEFYTLEDAYLNRMNWVKRLLTNQSFSCVIRSHGSSSSGGTGLIEHGGCGNEPAHHLHSGGRTGRERRVHLGIPRTAGQTQLKTVKH